jgi:hypothetical protein
MRKFLTIIGAASFAVLSIVAAATPSAEAAKGRKRALAAGAVLGLAAAAALSSNANAYERRGYERRSGWRSHCRRLYRKCVNGNDYACERYETGGCTE